MQTLHGYAMKYDYDEKALIQSCIEGNTEAQYVIYTQNAKKVYNSCYRITRNVEDAEDLVQEVFVTAFKSLHNFRNESKLSTWLRSIAIRMSLQHIKKKRIDLVYQDEIATSTEDESDAEFEMGDNTIGIEEIKEAVNELSNGYRIILSLYLLEGYSHQEIAEYLNINVGTSKSQYSRAKTQLKKILHKRYEKN